MSKKSMMPKSPELKLHPKLPPTTHPENRHGFAFFAARWKSCRRLTATKEASGCLRLRSSSRGVNGSEGGKLRGQMPHFRKARCGLFQKILGSTPLKKRSFKLRVFMSELWYSFFYTWALSWSWSCMMMILILIDLYDRWQLYQRNVQS